MPARGCHRATESQARSATLRAEHTTRKANGRGRGFPTTLVPYLYQGAGGCPSFLIHATTDDIRAHQELSRSREYRWFRNFEFHAPGTSVYLPQPEEPGPTRRESALPEIRAAYPARNPCSGSASGPNPFCEKPPLPPTPIRPDLGCERSVLPQTFLR